MQSFLDTTLQSALCVRGIGAGAKVQVILDNVAAGHRFPSGAAQDRRAWVSLDIQDELGGSIYQSGQVPDGVPVSALADPDLWLMQDCLRDEAGAETHSFWAAVSNGSNSLPGQLTFDASDPRFYQSHVYRNYPRSGFLQRYPDRVSLRVYLQPFGLDVFDDLVESGDLVDRDDVSVADMRAQLTPLTVGEALVWTREAATENYVEGGLPVACVSATNLLANADKVPAPEHARCSP